MSKIFDYENQVIMRFPPEIARKLHATLDESNNGNMCNVDIEHYLKKEGGAEKLEMKVRVDN